MKKANLEWYSAARHLDELDFTLSVTRWGNTSFDVRVDGRVAGCPVVTVDLVYVSVAPGAHVPFPIPTDIRAALAAAAA